jgi:hypothetical protein
MADYLYYIVMAVLFILLVVSEIMGMSPTQANGILDLIRLMMQRQQDQ